MSTNYYVKLSPCPCPCEHCAAPKRMHIGKRSIGWHFHFRGYKDGPQSWVEWQEYLKDKEIIDEYDDPIPLKKFVRLVESTRREGASNQYELVKKYYPELIEPHGYFRDRDGWSFNMTEFS